MTDIVLGIRLKADGSDLVGQVKTSEESLKKLKDATAANTSEAARLNAEHKSVAATMQFSAAEVQRYVDNLKREADTLGMTTLQIKAYRAAKMDFTDAQARSVAASLTAIKTHEEEAAAAERASTMIATATKAVAALAAAKVAATIVSVKSVLKEADDLNKESQALGVYVEWLSKFRYAGDLANISSDQLRNGLRQLTKQVEEAENGTGNGGKMFSLLGINITDVTGRVRTLDQLLPELADRFQNYAEGPRKTALALELFGRDGLRWIPLLNQGSQGLRENAEEAQRLGIVIGGDLARKSEEFRDNVTRIEAALHGMKVEMASGLLPTLSRFIQELNDGIKITGSFMGLARQTAAMGFDYGITRPDLPKRLSDKKAELDQYDNFIAGGGASAGDLRSRANLAQQYALLQAEQRQLALAGRDPNARDERNRYDTRADAPNLPKTAKAGGGGGTDNTLVRWLQEAENELQKLTDGELPEFDKFMRKVIASGKEFSDDELVEAAAIMGTVDVLRKKKEELKLLREEMERESKLQDEINKLIDARNQATLRDGEAISANLENIKFETSLIGKNNAEREKAIQLRQLEARSKTQAAGVEEDNRRELINALDAKAAAEAANEQQKKNLQEFNSLWSTVESTGKTVFTGLLSHGKGAFEGIGKALKASVIDLLYQMTVRKWVVNIGTSIAGSLGFGGTANASGGGLGGLLGGGGGGLGSLLSSGSSIFNLGTNGGVLNFGGSQMIADVGNFFGNIGTITEAGEVFGLGDAIMGFASANPVGMALAAAALVVGSGLLGGGGGGPAHTTGVDFQGVANALGAQGQWWGNAANSKESFRFAIPNGRGEEKVNAFIAQVFSSMQSSARMLGADPSVIAGKSYGFNYGLADGTPENVLKAAQAAMVGVTDQMARDLIPNIDELRQANESLTQTFQRLASAAQASKLDRIVSLVGGALNYLDSSRALQLSDVSPLTQWQRTQFSASDYTSTLQRAPTDPAAMAALPGVRDSYLREQRAWWGSSQQYTDVFNGVLWEAGNLSSSTLTEQSKQFADMGLTLKDISANTDKLDKRIAEVFTEAINAWQATNAAIVAAQTAALQQAITDSAKQTADTVNVSTAAVVQAVIEHTVGD